MAEFGIGTVVAVRADPARVGPIVEELVPVGGRRRFRVFHGPGDVREYLDDQVVVADDSGRVDPVAALAAGEWLDPIPFRARLTGSRLLHPQIDSLYALRAARIRFIPFQFKPILRLLRADRQRLLIADDVGVGKTIESGLVLKELEARQPIGNVLVLCPKSLTGKWRREMRRFDEDFRILSSETLRYCLDETDLEGEWPVEYSRAIVHYELFRSEPFLAGNDRRRGLVELDPPPAFGLLIADEAHHVRNPGRLGHQLMEYLCGLSEAVLLLTATPIQTQPENLFTLLRLLRPDQFLDRAIFDTMLEPNRFLAEAARVIRRTSEADPDWRATALACLEAAAQTQWGASVLTPDPRFIALKGELADSDGNDARDRIRYQRELEELHSFAHVMNRTRRRDIGRFTVREPHTVTVSFTPEEQQLYDELLEFRREVLLLEHDPQVVRLVLDTTERQAASSIHALARSIDAVLSHNGVRIGDLTDDSSDDDDDDIVVIPPELVVRAEGIRAMARALPDHDPKLDQLVAVVRDALDDPASPGKVLAFSYFLKTIDYLAERLSRIGARVGVVTGQVLDDERDRLRDRFRLDRADPNAIDVLISSEVGCEGLDYEFCDRMVNYDIPWNPMRIEQRIGRIDRFGQRSEKVLIFNFVTPGTVEERIFHRCFERIGVFRDAIGDLEEILGELVESLNRIALNPALTPEQAEERAHQLADNAVRQADEQRRVDEQAGDLFGLDDAVDAELEDVVARGRFVHADDLRVLIDDYLAEAGLDGRLRDRLDGTVELQLAPAARRELATRLRRHGRRAGSRADHDLPPHLEEASQVPVVVFDQELALDRRDLAFITPVHPLARLAAERVAADISVLIGGFRVDADNLTPGTYVFSFDRWEVLGIRPDVRLVTHAVESFSGRIDDALAQALMGPLSGARPLRAVRLDDELLRQRFEELTELADDRRRSALVGLAADNEVLVNRRRSSLEQSTQARRQRIETELREAENPAIQRMKTGQLRRLDDEFEQRLAELYRARDVDIVTARVALGIVEVAHGD